MDRGQIGQRKLDIEGQGKDRKVPQMKAGMKKTQAERGGTSWDAYSLLPCNKKNLNNNGPKIGGEQQCYGGRGNAMDPLASIMFTLDHEGREDHLTNITIIIDGKFVAD
ncbi:hypothetical protein HAX54_046478 [Datura stramonium]|uniref:Uncharacterized protein n=1 Tax=Datura stramonium TaxID=4076 RepID=A0ABS8WH44_DATST|nr:hypothetical protein [Datura stramonium]